MKKYIAGVFAVVMMAAGLVGFSGTAAVAEHCYSDSASKTATSAVGVEARKRFRARIFVQVTSFQQGARKGDLNVTFVKRTGKKAGKTWFFERRYNSNRHPRGKTYNFDGLPGGTYGAFVTFIPDRHCKFRPSAGNAKRVKVKGRR